MRFTTRRPRIPWLLPLLLAEVAGAQTVAPSPRADAGIAPDATIGSDRGAESDCPPADEILSRVDAQMTFDSRRSLARMTIHDRRQSRSKEMETWARGADTTFTVFTEPARDRGTKYLKRGGQLWMYLPSAEKVIRISGHMLRQAMMGSDFSYEDFLESPRLRDSYDARHDGDEEVEGRRCHVLELTANRAGVTYPRRRLWVDAEHAVPLKSEYFARGGKLVKRAMLYDLERFGERWQPTRIVMQNLLRRGTRTEVELVELAFDVRIPDRRFSQAQLRRGN